MPISPTNPSNVPVGTILSYAGDTTQSQAIIALIRAGWLPCDGSLFNCTDYPDLYTAIGTCHGGESVGSQVTRFRVPDMRTLYARGVDGAGGRDPGASARTAHARGGCCGNEVGSFQGFATSAPHNPFVTDSQGAHTHVVQPVTTTWHNAYGGGGDDKAHVNSGGNTQLASAGAHTHPVTGGGDAETRPVSLCMGWIIRFAPPA